MQSSLSRKITISVATALLALLCVLLPAAASAQPTYRGFQVHSLWYERSNTEMQRELDMVKDLGANVVRVDVGWSSLESDGKGVYTDWYLTKLDRFVQEARARELKVLPTLVSTPCWASSAPESLKQGCEGRWWDRGVQNYPPNSAADFADAARFVTSRYGDGLAAIELWNEPNTTRFLVSPDLAGAYTAMVKAAYPAVKSVAPGLPVLAGALAAADRPFLDQLYARGIKGYYDGISVHPYNEWRDPYDRWQEQWKKYTFLPGMEWVHEGQVANGDRTPLWITEFGWTTCAGGGWCVDENRQADYLVKGFQILNTLSYVYAATAYELRDESTDTGDFESNWGLVHQDFSPKPAYAAVRTELHSPVEVQPVTADVTVAKDGAVYVSGESLETQPVSITVYGCGQTQSLVRVAKTNRRGHYRRKLGRLSRLKGCSVAVRPRRSKRAAISSVPGSRGGVGVSAARIAS